MGSTLRVGIAGLGTVGVHTYKILTGTGKFVSKRAGSDVKVTAVSARSKDKNRGINLEGVEWFSDPVEMAKSDNVDLVVELIGGSEGVAFDVVAKALELNKSVVTANKALIAMRGKELSALQDKSSAIVYYEAAVAGGIPAIKVLREGLAANHFTSISGILNGTCNYILTEMDKTGRDFEDVLRDAQHKGYAEADPSFDVDGIDTAHKLAILGALAFGEMPDFESIKIEGMRNVTVDNLREAKEKGCTVKLLGEVRQTERGLEQTVKLSTLSDSHPLSTVHGVLNGVYYETEHAGDIFITGPGAGGEATASAVVADLIDIARGGKLPLFGG